MNKKVIAIVVVIVVVILIAWAIFATMNHGGGAQTQSQPAQAGSNGQSAAVPANLYTSSVDGFSVNFSGTPQVTKTTFNSPTAGSIPVTKYMAESGSGSSTKYYAVDVYHYPQSYQFPSGYLTGAMDIYAMAASAKYPGAKLTSSQSTQFLGSAAMAGTITITIDGQQSENYVLITTKGQNTYGIGTYGMDQSDYNAFVNSFTFTQ
jgi:uncharacterized protein YxeA